MKITQLTTYAVPPRWLFLKIETDDGVVGWGEPVLEGRAATVAAMVAELSDYLVGQDPRRIEDLWTVLYRGGFYRGGSVAMSALAGIDQALWDIKGKHFGVPIYDLLGGPVRDKMRVYAWIGGKDADECAASARTQVAAGYTALKMNGTEELEWIDSLSKVQQSVGRLAAVREAVGPEISIAIDLHGRAHKGMAKVLLRAYEPFHPMFVEEPVLSENNEALLELSRQSSIPLATGERMFSRWAFKPLLASGAVDIVQPDVSHCGGISELRKIATMAEAYDVAVAPHCPLGPICLAASLQVDFCTLNAFIQEQSLGIHYHEGSNLLDYLTDARVFDYQNGYVHRPTAPGLGIEINEEKVREMDRIGHNWRNPQWRNADGSVTEW